MDNQILHFVQNDSKPNAIDATRSNTLFRRFVPYAYAQNDKKSTLRMTNRTSKIMNSALILYEKFVDTLDEQQIIMFEEVLDKLFELNEELTKTDFKQGFKKGMLAAFHALSD